jgi:hypothetical protein
MRKLLMTMNSRRTMMLSAHDPEQRLLGTGEVADAPPLR